MIKQMLAWGAAAALVVVALQLVTRFAPDGASDRAPPERAPLPLPTGQGRSLDEAHDLQRQVQSGLVSDNTETQLPAAASPGMADAAPESDGVRRFTFDCGSGIVFAVRTVPGEATVFLPQALGAEVLTLPQVEAASGSRYAVDDAEFASVGGLATFVIRERLFADCTSNPGAATTAAALARVATFRALGNEPPWALEISPALLTLTTESGSKRMEFPYREPTAVGARTSYRSTLGSQELVVMIHRMPCNDTMSGELFDDTVAVSFDGTTLYGCGRAP